MKIKLSFVLVAVLMISILSCVNVFATNSISVYVDRELTQLMDANGNMVQPFVQNGSTYIPLRGVSQALGCVVKWDGDNKNILIYKDIEPDGQRFRNNSEDIKLYVDNEEKKLYDANGTEVKPLVREGTTYVPLRGVSKVLGYPVEWNGQTKSVLVWKNEVSPNGVTMDFLRPYEVDAPVAGLYVLYEADGETIKIDGIDYTNTIWGVFGTVSFNLDGKYSKLTGVLGYIPESTSQDDSTITFMVDGKIIKQLTVSPDSFAEKIDIELNNGLQLKILFNASDDDANYAALGDITFYGE